MAQSSSSASGCQSSHLSVSSCRKQECADSAESHDGCVGTNVSGLHEATHHDHGYKVNRDIEVNHPLNHDCSVFHNSRHVCEDPIETQGQCSEEDGLPKAKHCHHSHKEPADTHHGIHYYSNYCSHDSEEIKIMTKVTTNCCSNNSCKGPIKHSQE